MASDRSAAGKERRSRAQGRKAEQLQSALHNLDPELAVWADDFIFGQVWAREGMSQDERMLVAIVALTVGGHTPQLRNYLHGALEAGIPASKLREAMVMLTVYAGFPVALSGLVTWQEVVRSARRHGVPVDVELPE